MSLPQTEVVLQESPPRNRIFKKLLLEAVDEALSSLGTSSKHIYFHLEKEFNINKQNIPHKIEEFTNAIEKTFGPGARVLEIQIMKRLYEKVGPFKHFPERNLTFIEYVEAAGYLCASLFGDAHQA